MNLQTENRLDIAVLSDIHGNYVALESCLAHAVSQNIKTFLFLGDYVSELAYPERTMKLLYEMDRTCSCRFIRGNKEEYWFQYRAGLGGRFLHQRRHVIYIPFSDTGGHGFF